MMSIKGSFTNRTVHIIHQSPLLATFIESLNLSRSVHHYDSLLALGFPLLCCFSFNVGFYARWRCCYVNYEVSIQTRLC